MSKQVSIAVGMFAVVAAGSFLFYSTQGSRSADSGVAATKVTSTKTKGKPTRPVIVAHHRTFDLGVLNPGDQRRHKFIIENKGTADLTLELASTTCKCTLAEIGCKTIPPDGTGHIELEWHAEQPQFNFRQGATIRTNDPDIPLMELIGEGSVRVKLATLPESGYLTDVPRNVSRTLSLLLFSQAFADVTLTKIQTSAPDLVATIAQETPQTAPPQETRFLRELNVALKPQAKAGPYQGWVRLTYVGRLPGGVEESSQLEVPVTFEIVGDYSLHGRDVVGSTLLFGTVLRSVGAKKQLYLHVRNAEVDKLKLSVARTSPDFLRVMLGEAQQLTPSIARYPVTVEIPIDAPAVNRLDDHAAEIELTTTEPNHPVVRIAASFAVAP